MQKLFYLPEAHTDFIFSVVGEELGFIGVLVVVSMFLLLIIQGFRIALNADDPFGRYLAFGLTVLLGLEAFLNIAVVTGLLPPKGMALPFLSYGGSNLICSLTAVGILLSISNRKAGAEK
jgi:cell division protein FtsW